MTIQEIDILIKELVPLWNKIYMEIATICQEGQYKLGINNDISWAEFQLIREKYSDEHPTVILYNKALSKREEIIEELKSQL